MNQTVYLSFPALMPSLGDALDRVFSATCGPTLSRRQCRPGEPWPEALDRLLRQARLMVTVLPPDGPDRWQLRELTAARAIGADLGLVAVVPPTGEVTAALAWPRPWVELAHPEQLDELPAAVTAAIAQQGSAAAASLCPYPGLRPFTPAEACLFHGREQALEQLIAGVRNHRFTGLLGAPGSGKRSLIQAGLLPHFAAQHWETIDCRPANGGYHALASALLPLLEPDIPPSDQTAEATELGNHFEAGTLELAAMVRRLLELNTGSRGLLLHLDGLEHLIATADAKHARAFLSQLQQAVQQTPLRIIAGISTSAQAGLLAVLPELAQAIDWHCLGPLTRPQLRQALEAPAAVAGLSLEPGLSEALIDDAVAAGGHPALLACALRETWRRRAGDQLNPQLNLAGYVSARGLEQGLGGCLQRRADSAWAELPAEQRGQARHTWERLLRSQPGIADADVGGPLADAWPVARGWSEHQIAFDNWRCGLDRAITHWRDHDEQAADLLQGPPQHEAMAWLERDGERIDELQQRFIMAGHKPGKSSSSGSSSSRRRDRRLVLPLIVALGISLTALAFTGTRWWLDAAPTTVLITEPTAPGPSATPAAAPATSLDTQAADSGAAEPQPTATHHLLHDPTVAFTDLAFSPDGRQVITAGSDGDITLWSVDSGTRLRRLRAIDRSIARVKWVSGGKFLAVLGRNTALSVWQPPETKVNAIRQGRSSTLTSAAFNTRGGLLALADTRNGLGLYQTLSGKQLTRLPGHIGEVVATAFSPAATGRRGRLASGGENGDLWLWDLATREPVRRLMGHRSYINILTFNASGDTLLSAGGDGHLRLWNSHNGELLKTLKPANGRITQARFAPRGPLLATADSDSGIELWNGTTGNRLGRMEGHRGKIRALSFSPDAHWLVSTGRDPGIRLWSLAGSCRDSVKPALPAKSDALSISDGGPCTSADTAPIVLKPDNRSHFEQLRFTPDGRWLAAISTGGAVHLWLFDAVVAGAIDAGR